MDDALGFEPPAPPQMDLPKIRRLAADADLAERQGDKVKASYVRMRVLRSCLHIGISPGEAGLDARGRVLTPQQALEAAQEPENRAVALSEDQAEAMYRIWEQFSGRREPVRREPDHSTPDPNVFVLTGPGGSGKSTLAGEVLRTVRLLKEQTPEVQIVLPSWYREAPTGPLWCPRVVAMCAPTNQAALRQQQITGQCAGTHHSIGYERPVVDEETGELLGFVEREEGTALVHSRALLIEDEASMVSIKVRRDMSTALPDGVKRLVVGDGCQIPPVKAAPGYDLDHPDFTLTTVHRQAGGSPVLDAATDIRTRRQRITPNVLRGWGVQPHTVTYSDLGHFLAKGEIPVLLVRTNAARWRVNDATRRVLGRDWPPCKGDRIVAFSTNHAIQVANGEQGTVVFAKTGYPIGGEATWYMVVDWDGRGEVPVIVPKASWRPRGEKPWTPDACAAPLSRIRAAVGMDGTFRMIAAQPAYALTVHKAQGSEWPLGGILMESGGYARAGDWRLDYTALTRFAKAVYFFRVAPRGTVYASDMMRPGGPV